MPGMFCLVCQHKTECCIGVFNIGLALVARWVAQMHTNPA